MRLLGFEFKRVRSEAQVLSGIDSNRGWFNVMNVIRESFSGAWQSNITVDSTRENLAFSAVFACVTRIAGDIAKMRVKLTAEAADGICDEVEQDSPYLKVLRKQNSFQTRINFFEFWIICKLLFGNVYILKARESVRSMVNGLYILDPQRVTPLVAESGDVYYKLSVDHLSGLKEGITVPASEIIHDRMNCLFHPLVGVSPLYAAAISATQGRRIQNNSTKFFDNMSRPSGMLVAPGKIDDETARQFKTYWEENFSGRNLGRVAVLGNGMKYEAMTIPAQEAQLIEQLKWTAEDVARCFGVPFFKIGGTIPANNTIEVLNQIYYADCLQVLIESVEICLDEGLDLPAGKYTEFDLEGLLRMDSAAQIEMLGTAVSKGIMAPDEARKKRNFHAVPGGKYPYLQQQNFSLEALAKRDALPNPFVIDRPATNPTPSGAGPAVTADPAETPAQSAMRDLTDLANQLEEAFA